MAARRISDAIRSADGHGELGGDLSSGAQHAHGMDLSGRIGPGEELCIRQRRRQLGSLQ
jgi:hypothetical protein